MLGLLRTDISDVDWHRHRAATATPRDHASLTPRIVWVELLCTPI